MVVEGVFIARRALRRMAFEAWLVVVVVVDEVARAGSGGRGCDEGCAVEIMQTRQSTVSDPTVLHTAHFRTTVPQGLVPLSSARRDGGVPERIPCRPTLRITTVGAEADASCIEFLMSSDWPMRCWAALSDVVFCPALFVVTSALALLADSPGALIPIKPMRRSHTSPLVIALVPISAI